MPARSIHDLPTPSLLLDVDALDRNVGKMAERLPGSRLRPHVKAHKSTSVARRQSEAGHTGFCCATIREMEGLAEQGLGQDLLLANEVLDARRLGVLDARVTVAVDSEETLRAALEGGVGEVLIDVNVGLPRCGCAPQEAGALADRARALGLTVRGVMGYEGHVMGVESREERHAGCLASMRLLEQAHQDVGGEVVSAGGTGTWDFDMKVTEIQAGSYALMDTAYSRLALPFEQAFWIWATVISVSEKFAVADCGLKAMGMDHGNPDVDGSRVWFCSDEHLTFSRESLPRVGEKIRVVPAHVDPTVAYHEVFHLISGEEVLDTWPIDLRGW